MNGSFQSLLDAIAILPIGMAFILLVLWIISLLCNGLGSLFLKAAQAKERALAEAIKPVTPSEAEAPATDVDDIPLVIAAAIDRLLEGQAYRIISIKPLNDYAWVEQGRANLFNTRRSL